jgi:hypothetical protein
MIFDEEDRDHVEEMIHKLYANEKNKHSNHCKLVMQRWCRQDFEK